MCTESWPTANGTRLSEPFRLQFLCLPKSDPPLSSWFTATNHGPSLSLDAIRVIIKIKTDATVQRRDVRTILSSSRQRQTSDRSHPTKNRTVGCLIHRFAHSSAWNPNSTVHTSVTFTYMKVYTDHPGTINPYSPPYRRRKCTLARHQERSNGRSFRSFPL